MRILGLPFDEFVGSRCSYWEAMMRIARIIGAFVIALGLALAVAGTANAGGEMTHNTVDFPGMTHN